MPIRGKLPVPGGTYVRDEATRRYGPGTVFLEAGFLGVVQECVPSEAAPTGGLPRLWRIVLRRMEADEEVVHRIMIE